MTRMTPAELWTAIIRWDYLGPDRIRVRVPCGSVDRARWLRRRTGGHLKAGSVAATGKGIGALLRVLGQPEQQIAIATAYGLAESPEERRRLVGQLWAVLGLETRPRAVRL